VQYRNATEREGEDSRGGKDRGKADRTYGLHELLERSRTLENHHTAEMT
jgi:molybdenum-dependent DNA-binding transcriptional regulator ModE